jgi:hypothetical protein
VSDLDPSGSSHEDVRRTSIDDLAGFIAEPPIVAREGLPRSYRMRADSHYVDQLESRYDGRTIRLISTDEIDAGEGPASDVTALRQSIAAHGIVQPLLVRRSGTRYRLIAGRKRFVAAIAEGLSDVPCMVHDADDTKAAALAEADNLRDERGSAAGSREIAGIDHLQRVLASISAELTALDSAAGLLRTVPPQSFQRRVAIDLMQAQSWRAGWMAAAASVAAADEPVASLKPLACVLERVQKGFEAESRLTTLRLDVTASANASSFQIDESGAALAIAGGIYTTLSWMQAVDAPCIEIHAEAPNPRLLKIEIVQRTAPLPADAVGTRQAPDTANLPAAVGWLAMNTLVALHGGSVETSPVRGRGSVILLTIGAR